MTAAIKVTRVNRGIYDAEYRDRRFEVERYPCGSWMLFEVPVTYVDGAAREYWNDFCTKRDALAAIVAQVDSDALS